VDEVHDPYFTQQLDYFAVLILWFVYMSFGLQIFVCHLDQFQQIFLCCFSQSQHLITAADYSQIKISSAVLSHCNGSYVIIMCLLLLPLYCTFLFTLPPEYTFIKYNNVPF